MTAIIVASIIGQYSCGVGQSYRAPSTYSVPYVAGYNVAEVRTIFIPSAYAFYAAGTVGTVARQNSYMQSGQVQQSQPAPAPVTPSPQSPLQSPPQPSAQPPSKFPPQSQTDLQSKVMSWFANDCNNCHTEPADRGNGYVIFRSDGSINHLTSFDFKAIGDKILLGDMPKGHPYDASKKQVISDWLLEDSQNFLALLKRVKAATK